MKQEKKKWEWLYRILSFGLYDTLTAEYPANNERKKDTQLHSPNNKVIQKKRTTNTADLLKGYHIGLEEGKREALIEYQKTNTNRDLPSNEVLYKIFSLLFEYQQNNKSSVHMNEYEYYAEYIVTNWDKITV